MPETLLSAEALAWVGTEIEVECVRLTRAEVQRFLVGTSMPPTDLPDGEIAVPPMIYQALARPPVDTRLLTPDGMPHDRRPPVGEGRGMNGELQIEFRGPLRLGDKLRGTRRLLSLEPKRGRRRSMVVSHWRTEFRNESGDVVIVEDLRQILF